MSLDYARYGKIKVRVAKIERTDSRHFLKEVTVDVLLESPQFDVAYTKGDNTTTVPTDTTRNTIYVLAKKFPIDPIERFGIEVTNHFLTKYPHITKVNVDLTEHCWDRMTIDNAPHKFAFSKRQPEVRNATVVQERGAKPQVTSKILNLVVLKTTESAFEDFHRVCFAWFPYSLSLSSMI